MTDENFKNMNKQEALIALARGYRVNHDTWSYDLYLYSENGEIYNRGFGARDFDDGPELLTNDSLMELMMYEEGWNTCGKHNPPANNPGISNMLKRAKEEGVVIRPVDCKEDIYIKYDEDNFVSETGAYVFSFSPSFIMEYPEWEVYDNELYKKNERKKKLIKDIDKFREDRKNLLDKILEIELELKRLVM